MHSIDDLKSNNLKKIITKLEELKKRKLINKVGVSVYKLNNLEKIIRKNRVDIVQFPLSVFDLRFTNIKFLKELKKKKIEIFIRSIFLQGTIFLSEDKIKKIFGKKAKKIIKFKKDFNNDKDKMINYCLSFVKKFKYINGVIVGVNNSENLLQVTKRNKIIKIDAINKYSIRNEKILIPYNWKV